MKPQINPSSTDPYGHLIFCIGTGDDFYCFDYAIKEENREYIQIHATINSETGSFIMDDYLEVVPLCEAVDVAEMLTDRALEWLALDNHDEEGWNQKPTYFLDSIKESVQKELDKQENHTIVKN